jgi:hypothetical protein
LEADPGAGGWSRETPLSEAPASPSPRQRRSSEGAAGGGGGSGGARRRDGGAGRRGGGVGGRRRAAAAGGRAAPPRFPCSRAAAAVPRAWEATGARIGDNYLRLFVGVFRVVFAFVTSPVLLVR